MAEAGGRLRRRVFLSTEDPDGIAYFGALAPRWAASWTDGPRKPDRTKSTLAYVAEVIAAANSIGLHVMLGLIQCKRMASFGRAGAVLAAFKIAGPQARLPKHHAGVQDRGAEHPAWGAEPVGRPCGQLNLTLPSPHRCYQLNIKQQHRSETCSYPTAHYLHATI